MGKPYCSSCADLYVLSEDKGSCVPEKDSTCKEASSTDPKICIVCEDKYRLREDGVCISKNTIVNCKVYGLNHLKECNECNADLTLEEGVDGAADSCVKNIPNCEVSGDNYCEKCEDGYTSV